VRAGVGFYGKNTMLITRRHGSWVVLGTLVTTAVVEATAPLALDCGSCTLCIDACPTGALDEPGLVDATKCLSYWTQAPAAIPGLSAELGAQVYGCDICQDVCPWNRGIESAARMARRPPAPSLSVRLTDWLEGAAFPRQHFERLYVPRNDARYLRAMRSLLSGGRAPRPSACRAFFEGDDELLRAAEWTVADRGETCRLRREVWRELLLRVRRGRDGARRLVSDRARGRPRPHASPEV
jgi:epoxyqueuosine reductase